MPAATVTPGSWWFGRGWLPWPTAVSTAAVGAAGLTLRPAAGAPRDLTAPNGTLGGLALPPTLAVDRAALWLADRRRGRLRRFEPITGRFRAVPAAGHLGPEAGLAAGEGILAIADPGTHEVVVLAAGTETVRARLPLGDRRPVAVAVDAGRLLVLDERGTVRVSTPALDRLVPRYRTGAVGRGPWRRVLVDREGHPCLADPVNGRLLARTADGEWELIRTADEVRDRFPAPPLDVDSAGRFRVPSRLRLADSTDPGWFDATGKPVEIPPDEPLGPRWFATEGSWTGAPLDSRTMGCRWQRTTLSGTVPPGGSVTVRTYAADAPFDAAAVPDGAWSRPYVITGAAQPETPADSAVDSDFAVLADRGRFLSVRVELAGHGWTTPAVGRLLVEPQTPGLERFLPAIYRSDEQATDFLHRFLAIFGRELDGVEQRLRDLPALFSPAAAPDAWLDTLAAELGVPLERQWTTAQRRALLAAAPPLFPRRGTPEALYRMLRAHLAAATGRPVPDHVPVLVEGFRERPDALLGRARLPVGGLWSSSVVGRPRLGAPGRQDRITLISVGEQATDRFRVHANRFRVFVPRPYLPDREAWDRFERLIVAEKPAHVAHEIVTVEPRTVLGDQCLLGVDTYLGVRAPARLAGADRCGARLGSGLLLGDRGSARDRPPPVGRGNYLGVATVLI